MRSVLLFLFKYFWLFSSCILIIVGDMLFILRSIQDISETIKIYKENKDKEYLKQHLVAPKICLGCNIFLVFGIASFLYYASIHII
jgi:hypothetical protein